MISTPTVHPANQRIVYSRPPDWSMGCWKTTCSPGFLAIRLMPSILEQYQIDVPPWVSTKDRIGLEESLHKDLSTLNPDERQRAQYVGTFDATGEIKIIRILQPLPTNGELLQTPYIQHFGIQIPPTIDDSTIKHIEEIIRRHFEGLSVEEQSQVVYKVDFSVPGRFNVLTKICPNNEELFKETERRIRQQFSRADQSRLIFKRATGPNGELRLEYSIKPSAGDVSFANGGNPKKYLAKCPHFKHKNENINRQFHHQTTAAPTVGNRETGKHHSIPPNLKTETERIEESILGQIDIKDRPFIRFQHELIDGIIHTRYHKEAPSNNTMPKSAMSLLDQHKISLPPGVDYPREMIEEIIAQDLMQMSITKKSQAYYYISFDKHNNLQVHRAFIENLQDAFYKKDERLRNLFPPHLRHQLLFEHTTDASGMPLVKVLFAPDVSWVNVETPTKVGILPRYPPMVTATSSNPDQPPKRSSSQETPSKSILTDEAAGIPSKNSKPSSVKSQKETTVPTPVSNISQIPNLYNRNELIIQGEPALTQAIFQYQDEVVVSGVETATAQLTATFLQTQVLIVLVASMFIFENMAKILSTSARKFMAAIKSNHAPSPQLVLQPGDVNRIGEAYEIYKYGNVIVDSMENRLNGWMASPLSDEAYLSMVKIAAIKGDFDAMQVLIDNGLKILAPQYFGKDGRLISEQLSKKLLAIVARRSVPDNIVSKLESFTTPHIRYHSSSDNTFPIS